MTIPVVLALIAAFVLWKLWRRRMFQRQLRMARITPAELRALMDGESPPLILDVRSEPQRAQTGWIPGSVFVQTVAEAPLMPREEVIVYCDCPNEASAAVLARALNKRGFKRVRPLAGGFAAWKSEGQLISFE
jgi:rhodanese-related sulfurtransferase